MHENPGRLILLVLATLILVLAGVMPRAVLVLATLGLSRASVVCTVQSTLGCYVDDAAARVLNTSALDDASNSLEHCAAACFGAGFGGGPWLEIALAASLITRAGPGAALNPNGIPVVHRIFPSKSWASP